MPAGRFYWVSQLGMLAGTVVYVNAGTQLARIDSAAGILSPGLLISFALLGLFPLAAKKIVDAAKARRALAKWPRPAKFDRNLVVIGAGSAGLVTAYIAAAVKAKVTLVEKHRMGGDCLNTGCVPSKALIRSAKLLSHIRRSRSSASPAPAPISISPTSWSGCGAWSGRSSRTTRSSATPAWASRCCRARRGSPAPTVST